MTDDQSTDDVPPQLPPDGGTLYIGQPGTGKTTLMAKHHDGVNPAYAQSVLFNTMFKDYSKAPRVRKLNEDSWKLLQQHKKLTIDTNEEKEIVSWIEIFGKIWKEDGHAKERYGPMYFFVDEADTYSKVFTQGSPIELIATKGRNRGILGGFSCQSYAGQLATNIRKNCQMVYVFTLSDGEYNSYASKEYNLPTNPLFYEYYRIYRRKIVMPDGSEGEVKVKYYVTKDGTEHVVKEPESQARPEFEDEGEEEPEPEEEEQPEGTPNDEEEVPDKEEVEGDGVSTETESKELSKSSETKAPEVQK